MFYSRFDFFFGTPRYGCFCFIIGLLMKWLNSIKMLVQKYLLVTALMHGTINHGIVFITTAKLLSTRSKIRFCVGRNPATRVLVGNNAWRNFTWSIISRNSFQISNLIWFFTLLIYLFIFSPRCYSTKHMKSHKYPIGHCKMS